MGKCCDAKYVMDLEEKVFKISKNSGYEDQILGKTINYEGTVDEATNAKFKKLHEQAIKRNEKVTIEVCNNGTCIGEYTIENVEIKNDKYWFELLKVE